MGTPLAILFEIVSHMLGEQNVPGVPAIHHPLRHVDTGTSHVGAFVYVHHATGGPIVDAHPNLQARIVLERAADLYRTLRRLLRTLIKDQRHAVAGWDL